MNSKLFISTASQLDAAEICYLQWGNIICHEWLPKPINKMFAPLEISPIHLVMICTRGEISLYLTKEVVYWNRYVHFIL